MTDRPLNTIFTRAVMTADAVLNGTSEGAEDRLVIAQLEAALEKKPDDPLLCGYLGRILLQWEKYDKALPWLEKAAAGNAADEDIEYALGTALYKVGRYAEALPRLERTLNLWPLDGYCRMMAGYAAFRTGRTAQGRTLMAAAIDEIDLRDFEKEIGALVREGYPPPKP